MRNCRLFEAERCLMPCTWGICPKAAADAPKSNPGGPGILQFGANPTSHLRPPRLVGGDRPIIGKSLHKGSTSFVTRSSCGAHFFFVSFFRNQWCGLRCAWRSWQRHRTAFSSGGCTDWLPAGIAHTCRIGFDQLVAPFSVFLHSWSNNCGVLLSFYFVKRLSRSGRGADILCNWCWQSNNFVQTVWNLPGQLFLHLLPRAACELWRNVWMTDPGCLASNRNVSKVDWSSPSLSVLYCNTITTENFLAVLILSESSSWAGCSSAILLPIRV